jgi:hypothetical protein
MAAPTARASQRRQPGRMKRTRGVFTRLMAIPMHWENSRLIQKPRPNSITVSRAPMAVLKRSSRAMPARAFFMAGILPQ